MGLLSFNRRRYKTLESWRTLPNKDEYSKAACGEAYESESVQVQ